MRVFAVLLLFVAIVYSQTSCQNLYTFESGESGWYIDSSTVATSVASSTSYPTQGSAKSVRFGFNSGAKAIYKVEGPLDFTGYRYIQFDLQNVGGLSSIGLFIESNTWTESAATPALSNQRTYTFDLLGGTWKTQASNWQNNVNVTSLNSIQRMGIILYSTTGTNYAYVDNVRKCLANPATTSTSTATRAAVPTSTATRAPGATLTATATRAPAPTTTATATRAPAPTSTATSTRAPTTTSPGPGFIYPCGTRFCKDGCKYFYAGTNMYYLIYQSNSLVINALDTAVSLGANVVRTWAFLEGGNILGVSNFNGYSLQTSFGYGNPPINAGDYGLNHLDDVIYLAKQRGVKLILALSDNWRSFGGIDQYASWWSKDKHDNFFSETVIKDCFKRWISTVLNRVNHNDNVVYKNDPTIMAWELINEPRCAGSGLFWTSGNCNTTMISNWVLEMSNYIRSIDTKHMIGVGDEGFFARSSTTDWTYNAGAVGGGVDFDTYLTFPNINFGTFHMYPDAWGKDTINWPVQWINDHAAAVAKGKPVILEEYGWYNDGNRPNYFTTWLNAVYNSGLAGSNFWMLGVPGSPGDNYLLTTSDTTTLNVFTAHKNAMLAKNTCP